jgi:hypothetical protein
LHLEASWNWYWKLLPPVEIEPVSTASKMYTQFLCYDSLWN